MRQVLAVFLLIFYAEPAATDGPLQFSSGDSRVAVIELFTSEGCSSCPPADRWFSELKHRDGLWKTFVPVVFHVDYWDYIGWRDRFARAAFSDRQRRYAREGAVRTVYTPGVFRDGFEWRGWYRGESPHAGDSEIGDLTITVDDSEIVATFQPVTEIDDALLLNVAILGMNRESQVTRGENTGRLLRHDFVVLGTRSSPLQKGGDFLAADLELPDISKGETADAIIAWVTTANRLAPLQATGGYLSR